jgi:hypothetical protein
LLADGSDLSITHGTDGAIISGPAQPPDPIDTVIVSEVS